MTKHNRKHFFKYVSADVAQKILSTLLVRCSSPKLFNDPFDSQFTIQLDVCKGEEFNQRFATAFSDEVMKAFNISQNEKAKNIIIKEMLKDASTAAEKFKEIFDELNKNINEKFYYDRIFCLSEKNDNLLMWAHYSDNHKGAVIKLKCLTGDYALQAAQKVNYSYDMPKLTVEEITKDHFSYEPFVINKIIKEMLLTKSIDWEHENEWRVILLKLDPNAEFDLRGISAEEIEAIYLGCKMSDENKRKIITIIKEKLQHVKVYKAMKNDFQFKIDFVELIL